MPVPLASGSRGSHVNADYDADGAREAVEAMRAIYLALHDHPKASVGKFVTDNEVMLGRIGRGEPTHY